MPKSCKGSLDFGWRLSVNAESCITEMEADKHLDARHAIEEAMSRSLSFSFTTDLLMVFISSCAQEKLSQVSERSVITTISCIQSSHDAIYIQAFVKEDGVSIFSGRNTPYSKLTPMMSFWQCNKMRCSNCSTMSCYVCRKIINGYDHFNQVIVCLLRLL